ncbi:class I SAM-dependent methyltransferase [Sulfuricurvum sp.]|uniref:class I SAM-dependent methyltransferase n=1 Tax=Sulfuricurvum sp. TaxID=2025608 RepID=UPI003BB0ACE0
MSDQREFWNERYEREGYFYGKEPNRYLASHIDTLEAGKEILFLGEGEGRNAVYAAKAGHRVTALDASDIGLAKASALAQSAGCTITCIHADLEEWEPSGHYDAIFCSFLHLAEPLRSDVFSKMIQHLKSGGLFAGEFFSIHQLPRTTGGPKDETLLYTADALRSILEHTPCEILELCEIETELNEGRGHIGIASVVRMAVRK